MRRPLVPATVALLAAALSSCLLYTDPINSPPQVMIVGPTSIFPNQTLTLEARASDPDGDALTMTWELVKRRCAEVKPADWDPQTQVSHAAMFRMNVTGHDPFCVRVVATDRHGATTASPSYDGAPLNRAPTMVKLSADGDAAGSYPLFSTVRLTASPSVDEDGDPITFTWKVLDPSGADGSKDLGPCDPPQPALVRCLSVVHSGAYTVSVSASDGLPGGDAAITSLTLPVQEDRPPCIELSDPAAETSTVVMVTTDRPRRFEVRRVKDDGNPYPAGPHGGASFHWSTAVGEKPDGPFRVEVGYDQPTFEVSATLFEDARPGSSYQVRVDVRDPLREPNREVERLEAACATSRLCEAPVGCVRRITWTVKFR